MSIAEALATFTCDSDGKGLFGDCSVDGFTPAAFVDILLHDDEGQMCPQGVMM